MKSGSNPIDEVVARFGGQNALARLLGTTQSTVWGWVSRQEVPYARVKDIIALGARQQPPVTLCPNDFFDLSGGA